MIYYPLFNFLYWLCYLLESPLSLKPATNQQTMDTRREFLKNMGMLSGGARLLHIMPASIAKALAIDPAPGSTFLDAEHIVFLMQENRSFDHAYGTLQGVRGFNDPRAIQLPDKNLVWLQTNKAGETYCPFRLDINDTKATWMSSLPHGWTDQVDARNDGRYDKWLEAKPSWKYKEMPLTLGYHTREDIPFYYAMADAFTVCDHNFCSSLTGTTPNRLYFWSGTIRAEQNGNTQANVWNEDADYDTPVSWNTFPEQLEANGISWKVYQNELSVGVGFKGEEDAWLSNFGDNPLEYFTQYKVKFHQAYMDNLDNAIAGTKEELAKQEQQLQAQTPNSDEWKKAEKKIKDLKYQLAVYLADKEEYTSANYEKLSQKEKDLHEKAFSTNKKDPAYHQLETLTYKDGDTDRTMQAPKGDVLHEFREDVKNGKLPAVSWIVAPENFSDHPTAAWYGVWYISECLDILTANPEVWKKTIFILTYDENDGYYDHLPPFVAPHPDKKDIGTTSAGIDTAVDYVASTGLQSRASGARESSIGLGYRVPMVIASPWSRGGWVNSEVFDHTSSLQFLEYFLSHKTGKKIEAPLISKWRRTVCGNLTSAFRPYNGEKITLPEFLERDPFIEGIHKAQFKGLPDNFKKLSAEEIAAINKDPYSSSLMPQQEKGTRSACSIPYELYADGVLSADGKKIEIVLKAGNQQFRQHAAGSPFHVYAPGVFQQQPVKAWSYAVAAGAQLKDSWALQDFAGGQYFLRVYGPNGFFRELMGSQQDPVLEILCAYPADLLRRDLVTAGFQLQFFNKGNTPLTIEVIDNAYKYPTKTVTVRRFSKSKPDVLSFDLRKSSGWYDFTVKVKGFPHYSRRYAGRVEDGRPGKTDPFMGRVV